MRKKIITGALIAGAALCTVGIAGCSGSDVTRSGGVTKEELLDAATTTFASLKSMDIDIKSDIKMNISAEGVSMDMVSDGDINVVSSEEGVSHLTGDAKVSALGQNLDMDYETYTVKEGNEYTVYTKASQAGEEGNWTYTKVDAPDSLESVSEMSVSQVTQTYNKLKDTLSDLTLQNGTVSYNGTDCYVISGTIPGEKFAELTGSSGQNLTGADADTLKLMDVDTELYFKSSDKTPYALVMDMSKAIENVIDSQMGGVGNYTITSDAAEMSLVFNDINQDVNIVIPEDIKQSAVEGENSVEIQDMLSIF